MRIRTEFLYDPLMNVTRIYVWFGMRLVEQAIIEGAVDAYEQDGIIEKKDKKWKHLKCK